MIFFFPEILLQPLLNLKIPGIRITVKMATGKRELDVLSINSQNPQMRLIKKVVDVLRDGGVIIYPTDTVYGLGCDLSNKKGIERIYEIKRRNKKQPLSFVCSDLKHISQYAMVTDYAYKTMKRFLPGPYTFILEASRLVPKIILPKRPTTGIRVPDNQICLALIRELGQPIISTSVKTQEEKISAILHSSTNTSDVSLI